MVNYNLKSRISERDFNKVIAVLVISSIFIVSGSFWLTKLLDVRVVSQIIVYAAIVVIFTPIILKSIHVYYSEPIFLLTLSLLFSSIFFARGELVVLLNIINVFVVAALLSTRKKYADSITISIISMATFFSLLGITQFFIILFNPDLVLVGNFSVFEKQYLQHEYISLHPLMILGFTTGEQYELFGINISRVHSFIKEPSMMVPFFFFFVILALSYQGWIKYLSIPLILFSLLSFSGAVVASMVIVFGFFGLYILAKGNMKLLSVMPIALLVVFCILLTVFDLHWLVDQVMIQLDKIKDNATFLEKTSSFIVRLEEIKLGFLSIKENIFGIPNLIVKVGGVFFYSFYYSGVVGGLMVLLVFREYFNLTASLRGFVPLSFVLLIYGTFTQILILTSGGFYEPSGFLVMTLLLMRLRALNLKVKKIR